MTCSVITSCLAPLLTSPCVCIHVHVFGSRVVGHLAGNRRYVGGGYGNLGADLATMQALVGYIVTQVRG